MAVAQTKKVATGVVRSDQILDITREAKPREYFDGWAVEVKSRSQLAVDI